MSAGCAALTLRHAAGASELPKPEGLLRLQAKLEGLLGTCEGIDLEGCDLVSEAEFSLADLRHFRRWDFGYRSHSGKPGGVVAPIV